MMRRTCLAVVVGLGLVASACSLEQALPVPDCIEGGSGLIVAQSVSTAELVPCLGPLPDGWSVEAVTVDQDGSEVRLDSDRAGDSAARLLYRQTCDVGEAVSVPSDQEGAEAYEYVGRITPGFQADRLYLFEGGCVRWEFDFDTDASATLSIELQDSLTLLSRTALNESIRESFIDEEL
ncbi:MAG: hypothetical protein OEV40_11880 [Acidimicrobiia bacterium]|nr:hypothetical protein [Acidimicrobiia bacterium]